MGNSSSKAKPYPLSHPGLGEPVLYDSQYGYYQPGRGPSNKGKERADGYYNYPTQPYAYPQQPQAYWPATQPYQGIVMQGQPQCMPHRTQ
jgi:hypothetical protein